MTLTRTHGGQLVTGVVTVLLAIPLFGLLLWGAWRLLFWGVVAAAPHAHYGPAAGMATPSAVPPGVDAVLLGGWLSAPAPTVGTLVVAAVLALACLMLAVSVLTARTGDDHVD
jgi:hypothetical protein